MHKLMSPDHSLLTQQHQLQVHRIQNSHSTTIKQDFQRSITGLKTSLRETRDALATSKHKHSFLASFESLSMFTLQHKRKSTNTKHETNKSLSLWYQTHKKRTMWMKTQPVRA